MRPLSSSAAHLPCPAHPERRWEPVTPAFPGSGAGKSSAYPARSPRSSVKRAARCRRPTRLSYIGGLNYREAHVGRQKEARRDPPLPTPRHAYKQDGYSLSSGYSGIFPICFYCRELWRIADDRLSRDFDRFTTSKAFFPETGLPLS